MKYSPVHHRTQVLVTDRKNPPLSGVCLNSCTKDAASILTRYLTKRAEGHFLAALLGAALLAASPSFAQTPEEKPEIQAQEQIAEAPPELYASTPETSLILAAVENNTNSAKKILAECAFVDQSTTEKTDPEILKSFPALPKNIRNILKYDMGVTPLMIAAAQGNRDLCQLLLENKATKWKQTKNYRKDALTLALENYHFETAYVILGISEDSPVRKTKIEISLSDQVGVFYSPSERPMEFEISSGKKSKPTPKGSYLVTQKNIDHVSNIYHSPMPFFLRLSSRDFGLHAGQLPGYPASHGCIRIGRKNAKTLFQKVELGTKVEIK